MKKPKLVSWMMRLDTHSLVTTVTQTWNLTVTRHVIEAILDCPLTSQLVI